MDRTTASGAAKVDGIVRLISAVVEQRGGYAGRGPKNYQRSDERVREDVIERMTDHPDLDPTDIDVKVQHCEVTLSGEVDERYAKHLAEDLAGQVWGVRDVHNQLRVRRRDETGQMSEGAPKA
jgi:osmotically-inducible protein OsmY